MFRWASIESVKAFIAEYWSSLVGWIGATSLGIGLSNAREKGEWVTWAALIIVCSLTAMLVSFIYRKRAEATRRSLVAEKERLAGDIEGAEQSLSTAKADIDTLVDGFLATIAKDLGLTDTDRVSLYRPHPTYKSGFARVGRHSDNPVYRTNGRDRYPSNCDVISEAWEKGRSSRQLDDPTLGGENLQRYNEAIIKNHAVLDSEVRRLSMRSIDLHGFQLKHRSAPYHPVGVVVFESTRHDTLHVEQLREIITMHGDRLTLFVEKARPVVPNQQLANRIEH